MEFLSILLSALLTLGSPPGLIIDRVVENILSSRLERVEQLDVRIDNTPNYRALQGKLEQVRIAGRGLWLTPDIRIDVLEVETDPINLDIKRLRQEGQTSPLASLRQPLQAGVRLVLTESDLNQMLQSPRVAAKLQQLGSRLSRDTAQRYQFLNPRLELLGNNRLRFQVDAVEGNRQSLAIVVESGLGIEAGHRLQLIEPRVTVDGQALPSRLVEGFAKGISDRANLRSLEDAGITVRLLQLEIDNQDLQIAAFVRADVPQAD